MDWTKELFEAAKAMGWGGAVLFGALYWREMSKRDQERKEYRERETAFYAALQRMREENVALLERVILTMSDLNQTIALFREGVTQTLAALPRRRS